MIRKLVEDVYSVLLQSQAKAYESVNDAFSSLPKQTYVNSWVNTYIVTKNHGIYGILW